MQLPKPLDILSAEDQRIVSEHLQPVHFAAQQCIFRQGSPGDACYIVQAGDVRLELEQDKHIETECVLGYQGQGSVLGELAVLDGLPRSASAYAETDVTAQCLSSKVIEQLCATHPSIGVELLRALARDTSLKLRRSNERIADFIVSAAPDPEVDRMVAQAIEAQRRFEEWPEERVDALLLALATAVADQAEPLARATVKETMIGDVADKTRKNMFASLAIYHSLKGEIGLGVIKSDSNRRVTEIASPAGVVFGLVPITTPVATAVFKALIALKARCALILSFHRGCIEVGNAVCDIMQSVLDQHGAPAGVLQWVRMRSGRIKTAKFMSHPGVSLVLATGGAGMVEAAYGSGTPALGVGPGNTPVYVASDADVAAAAHAITLSKPSDNGLICGAEHNILVDARVRDTLVQAFERSGAAVLNPDEAKRFLDTAVGPDGQSFDRRMVGQSAQRIAGFLGVKRDYPIRLIVIPAPVEVVDGRSPLAGEKLAPIVSLLTVHSDDEAFALCRRLLAFQGAGHTAVIHTQSDERANAFGLAMPASRILVNSPAVQGISGQGTGLVPSYMLGCGTFGGNSTTDNISLRHLQNIKRLAHFLEPAQTGANTSTIANAAAGTDRRFADTNGRIASGRRPVTLITGASGGLGAALARTFAENNHELVLIARKEQPLADLADEIAAMGRPRPLVLALDITRHDIAESISRELAARGLEPQYVVNNAGFGLLGHAADLDRPEQLAMVDLNVRTLVDLSLAFVDSLSRHRGGILNVASVAGFMPGPGMAVYYASKAFVVSLSEALQIELVGKGIRVTVLSPGPVPTGFQSRAGIPASSQPSVLRSSAQTVARRAYDGLMRGELHVIPGVGNWIATMLPRFLPRWLTTRMVASMQLKRLNSD
jgi:short-subunit dehydrogenase/acyl-CoA reductase-like NAD-dependent aldehyde dehydrogenase